jgi:protein TonB
VFDHYVAPVSPSWQRRALFAGSVGFHAAAAAGLIVWSVLHVQELAPPEVTLTFFSAAPPPPPPPPPAAKKVDPKPKVMTRPTVVEPLAKEAPKPPEPEPEPEGQVGGVAGGVPGGVVGGVPTAAPAPPPPPQAAAPPKMVASFIFDRERLQAPDPHLPSDFINRHPKQTFTATYRICVGKEGRITEVAVVRGIEGIDDAVLQQIRSTWTYKPQPLPVCSIRNFVFKVN